MTETSEDLEQRLNEFDESPFGKLEFGASVEDDYVHIRHFKVDPDWRRHGIGSEKLQEIINVVQESDLEINEIGMHLKEKGGSREFLQSFDFEDINEYEQEDQTFVSGTLYL